MSYWGVCPEAFGELEVAGMVHRDNVIGLGKRTGQLKAESETSAGTINELSSKCKRMLLLEYGTESHE